MRNLLVALAAASAPFAAGPRKDPVPLFFIENQGQAPPAVRFMAQGSGMTAWFSPQEILFRVAKTGLELRFLGAQPAPVIEGLDPLGGARELPDGPRSGMAHRGSAVPRRRL